MVPNRSYDQAVILLVADPQGDAVRYAPSCFDTERGFNVVAALCEERERLIIQWHDAILAFGNCVGGLAARNNSGNGFAAHYEKTERARLHAENARTILELHRSEHGC
jgi:hypothetical protein